MKRTVINKTIIYALIMGLVMLVAQSCSTTKHCGCGADINGIYKRPKRIF